MDVRHESWDGKVVHDGSIDFFLYRRSSHGV